ncbi:hypothetical protein [Haloarchaeobius amylolyticus]|nr:hypothetical protein [Haloarchaeobius amylolyticus]
MSGDNRTARIREWAELVGEQVPDAIETRANGSIAERRSPGEREN